MIHIKNITKSFGEHRVLDALDLKIPKGKITVIIGRSGEGKSVLIKHLLGLIRPDGGEVWVEGQNILDLDEFALNDFRKKFGLLFQNAALFDSMNVYDNMAFPLREHSGKNEKQIQDRIHDLINLVGLKETVLAKFPSELSGGMRKRVGLARAIALNPEILLYDEPTTGLDPIMTDVIDHLILDTQEKLGVTSVVISHDIQATLAIADKIAMLHEGKILLEGSPEVFKNSRHPTIKNFLEGKASEQQLKELS
jgi:phospholipid/cholesterol/gamma-HCH transport system ATP-binding protein